jgi:MerR family transcriptional regulator, light-induced transcriptional regulator
LGKFILCLNIVSILLEGKIKIRKLYTDLFQKSMYSIGELWEINEISVARERLATTITENMLNVTHPYLFTDTQSAKAAVISRTANEYHQLGGKMVADIFELHGWDAHFPGENTPVEELLTCIGKTKPDLIGLSLAIYANLPALKATLEAIKSNYKGIDILVGGHAFAWGDTEVMKKYAATNHFNSLARLEVNI